MRSADMSSREPAVSAVAIDAEGYLLHLRPYRETSALIEVWLFGHGRLGLVARGISGPRASSRRAVLQPWQPLRLRFSLRGELGQLQDVEALSAPLRLGGERALAGLYINELLMRLLPRMQPHDQLFQRYAALLGELEQTGVVARSLRQFELDLLEELGWAIDLEHTAHGAALDPAGWYRWDPDQGMLTAESRTGAVRGDALLAMAAMQPLPEGQADGLRRMLRTALLHYLGGRPLSAWKLAESVRALRRGRAD